MAFERYLQEVHGFRHQVCSPDTLLGPFGGDLLRSICADDQLVAALRKHGGVLEPLIQRRGLAGVARLAHLELPHTSGRLLINDDVLRSLNNKRWFQQTCNHLGIPVPTSEWHRGQHHVLAAALRLLRTYPELRLRKAVSAGGLAVVALRRPDHGGIWYQRDLEAQLTGVDWFAWNHDDVAVEPFIPDLDPFSVMMRIAAVGPVFRESCDRIVFGGTESGGGITPSNLPRPVLRRAIRMTMRFGWELWRLGYRGEADMDWGLKEGGGLVAFESNVRVPATMIQVALRQNQSNGQGVALSRDFIKVGDKTTIDEVVAFLRQATIICDRVSYLDLNWRGPDRGFGVFVTLEPKDGVMAYIVLGHSRAQVEKINQTLSEWCAEQACTSAPPAAAEGG